MSAELDARAVDVTRARADWREHLANCAVCANARHRRNRQRCLEGIAILEDCRLAELALAEQHERDREQADGQQLELFPMPEMWTPRPLSPGAQALVDSIYEDE